MATSKRIYLDNAATSWPKPDSVYQAVDEYLRDVGAPAGRSGYAEALQVEHTVSQLRREIARLLAVDDYRRIVFTCNGTDSLNLAIHGLLQPGDHVVTSVVEHNSVLRPLRQWEETNEVRVTRVACDALGMIDPDDVRSALRSNTRLVAITHASNVTGTVQRANEIGKIVRESHACYLVDAAQTLGHIPVSVESIGCDLLAAPGHKGLLGPLGTGVLYVAPGVEKKLRAIRHGGTGTHSEDDRQPDSLPEKYESGNHNVPGLVGLAAGIAYLNDCGLTAIEMQERQLTDRLLSAIADIDGLALHGPVGTASRLGVVSVTVDGYDPHEVAAILDSSYTIQVRSGLHCAPLIHESLGTIRRGGTIRMSLGPFNCQDQIDTTIAALRTIAASAPTP